MSRYSDNDAPFMTGVTPGIVLGNEETQPESQAAIAQEKEYLSSILPNAEQQVAAINTELSSMNNLVEFVNSLGGLPTDMALKKLQSKLEARFAYMTYLATRKQGITNSLAAVNRSVSDVMAPSPAPTLAELTPVPPHDDVDDDALEPLPFWQKVRLLFSPWRPRM